MNRGNNDTTAKRMSFLNNPMFQLLVFIIAMSISFWVFNYSPGQIYSSESPPISVLNNVPITIITITFIIWGGMNICLGILLKKWRKLPINKLAYKKELARKQKAIEYKLSLVEKFKQLKEKKEQGEMLTPQEEKWLKEYMGLIWYATLKIKKGRG